MSHGVQTLGITQLRLSPLPQSPTPVKLSFLDSCFTTIKPVQELLLYPNPAADIIFPSLLQALKSSLSSTLLNFMPLAGKLTYVQTTRDIEINLSNPNVTFVEAESGLDLHHLATSEIHDVESFMELVPKIDVSAIPISAFSVQVTRFCCGGVAIGYSYHHAAADGKSMLRFMEAWANVCRAKLSGAEVSVSECPKPSYDRSSIKHPARDEISRTYVQFLMPNPPATGAPSVTAIEERRLLFSRRTYVLDVPSIQSLKRKASQGGGASQPPSTFVAIAAYTWSCYVRTESSDPNSETNFICAMDCRTMLNPPLDDDYFGNCLRPNITTISVREMIGEDGFNRVCTAMRESIVENRKDPLGGCEDWVVKVDSLLPDRTFRVICCPRFRVYDTDFGWGRPDRVETVSMNENEFALHAGKEEGSVQVSVVQKPEQMKAFSELFLGGLNA